MGTIYSEQTLIQRNVPLRLKLLNLINLPSMDKFMPVVLPSGSGGKFGSLSELEGVFSRRLLLSVRK